jgi:RNA polymerase sigma-70 factor (ECF subfamily)
MLAAQSAMERGPGSKAFTELVREHQSMVFSIACHFLRDRSMAEEIAQDVFLQLYRNLESLESEAHVAFWLRRVTSNRCVDYVRKRQRRPETSLDDGPEPRNVEATGDPLLSRKLRALVQSLPEKPRLVMILRFQEDLMPEEIARTLDMPVRTVKSILHRSLAMLREKMERSMGDPR